MKRLICFLLFSPHLWAAYSNHNSILIGDLAAGLSGAGTAIQGDVSSASFYNPALLSNLKGSSFSAAVGIYKKFDTVFNQKEDLLAAPLRVNKGYFRSLPSATGQVIDYEGYKLALSIVTPDYDQFSGRVFSSGTETKNMNFTDESLWVGASLSNQWNEKTFWGLTAYYTARNFSQQEIERDVPSATELEYRSEDRSIKENAIVTILGIYHQLNDKLGLGASLRWTPLVINGSAGIKETLISASGGSVTLQAPESESLKSQVFIPARLNLGLSYQISSSLQMAWDIHIHEGLRFYDLKNRTDSTLVHMDSVVNTSLGFENTFRDWLKLRAGIFTNFSAHPDPNPSLLRNQKDHVDMLGFSTNFVFISDKKIAYTFGGYYTGGSGRSLQKNFNDYTVITKRQNIFTMLVGTSLNF